MIAQANDGVGIIVADVDTALVQQQRTELPSLANRQPAAYTLAEAGVAALR